jgi:hypothetical protein
MLHGLVVLAVPLLVLAWPLVAVAGAIQGTVLLRGAPSETRKLPVTIDQYVCGQEKEAEDLIVSPRSGVKYVVAWLENPPAVARPTATPAMEMDQKGCMFTPRVIVVPTACSTTCTAGPGRTPRSTAPSRRAARSR